MKIYEENQFTKNVRSQEDLEDKSYDDEFAKHIVKCIKGPAKNGGDKIIKMNENFNEKN